MTTLLVLIAGSVVAGQWTAPLAFEVSSDGGDERLVTHFDVGQRFSSVERVRFSGRFPEGFTGFVAATSNSSYSSSLSIGLEGVPDSTTVQLITSILSVPADTLVTFDITLPWQLRLPSIEELVSIDQPLLIDGEFPGYAEDPPRPTATFIVPEWPETLLDGTGRISLAAVFSSVFAPLPERAVVRSSTVFSAPAGGVTDATVTVFGVAVPEPQAMGIAAIACGLAGRRWFVTRRG
ncbi:MAG: hypothetical protein AAF805_12430 [Planctomycetota bacterium]